MQLSAKRSTCLVNIWSVRRRPPDLSPDGDKQLLLQCHFAVTIWILRESHFYDYEGFRPAISVSSAVCNSSRLAKGLSKPGP